LPFLPGLATGSGVEGKAKRLAKSHQCPLGGIGLGGLEGEVMGFAEVASAVSPVVTQGKKSDGPSDDVFVSKLLPPFVYTSGLVIVLKALREDR
jgi:hypothetical protein